MYTLLNSMFLYIKKYKTDGLVSIKTLKRNKSIKLTCLIITLQSICTTLANIQINIRSFGLKIKIIERCRRRGPKMADLVANVTPSQN